MRLSEAIERAITESDGFVRIVVSDFHNKSEDIENILMSAKSFVLMMGTRSPEIEPRLFSFNSPYGACPDCNGLGTKNFFGDEPCDTCHGARLREEALNVFLGDRDKGMNIVKFTNQSIEEAYDFITKIKFTKKEKEISISVLKEIEDRLKFMLNVGLDYLTLNRKANTLSGGESQRIRLASQLGSRLVGALYVLDEPTIGLHQRDNDKLIKTLEDLRDLGNTIIVVEHDEDTIYASDYIIDIGPKAGVHGGEIVVADYLDVILSQEKVILLNHELFLYLREEEVIPLPESRREANKGWIRIKGGKVFNIKNINVEIPLGRMTAITGVSGSGKSSFLYEILHKNLQARFDRKYRSAKVFNCAEFSGTENLSRAILIDQSPIGRTPRSNIATYTGAWGHIRDMFAATDEARFRGWKANRFSFNVKGGRCEACEGKGLQAVEMHFLPTVYVTCDVCNGKRFDKETLKVKNIKEKVYTMYSSNDRRRGSGFL